MTRASLLWVASIACASFASASAHAETSADESSRIGPSVALSAGYGAQLGTFPGGVTSYGVGFGARAGVTLPMHIYLGGTFVAHLGTYETAKGDGGAFYEARYRDTYFGPEVGYDWNLGRFLVRPVVSAGALVAVAHTTAVRTTWNDDNVYFYVAPGVVAAVRVQSLLVGLDLRMPLAPAQSPDDWAVSAMMTVGMQFGSRR